MADTRTETPADEMREAVIRLREHLVPAVTARVLKHTAIVAICGNHDPSAQTCVRCQLFDVQDRVLARLVATLINAREPLASWLEETADEAERHEAQGMGNAQDEVIHGPCLAVARVLNGGAS